MNKHIKPSYLPVLTLAGGLLGLALRAWLVLTGVDERGLLVTTHPAHTLVFILAALMLAVIFLCVRPLDTSKNHQMQFSNGILSGTGCIVAALGILWGCLRDRNARTDIVTNVCLVLGVLAVICLIAVAICRFTQRRPTFYLHVVITLFLMVHLVSQYRLWSFDPQLHLYFFPLLSSALLMLTAYHHAALDSQKPNHQWFMFCNQSALFFCCVSLWSDSWLFYLTMAFWLFTNFCSLAPESPENGKEAG